MEEPQTDEPSEQRRPIGRGHKVRTAVLAATLTELTESGYHALSIDNVARRAGVHKTTVYRRWPTREDLVVDALVDHINVEVPVPDTGCIESDLRELGRSFIHWANSTSGRAVLATMLADGIRFAEIADARRTFYTDRFQTAGVVITRAIERGELPASVDRVKMLKSLLAPIYFRLLVMPEPIDESTADYAAKLALAAARAGVFAKQRSRQGRHGAGPYAGTPIDEAGTDLSAFSTDRRTRLGWSRLSCHLPG
jgi:AcrR family transcriptional regulator